MRTIDADALKKLVKEFRDDAPTRKYVCNVVLSMLGDENQTPTIDAVPVVRCKDCKYAGKGPAIFTPWHINCGLRMRPAPVRPDDFCSYGVRRDDHGQD